jgi:hypothetical protein
MADSPFSTLHQFPREAVSILHGKRNKPRSGNQHVSVVSQGVAEPPMKESR